MTMLIVKCQECGKVTEQPWEFEMFFAAPPETDKIYDGYCNEKCESIAMDKIAKSGAGAEKAARDLEIECRTDGSRWK
jgi:hypothetical protein